MQFERRGGDRDRAPAAGSGVRMRCTWRGQVHGRGQRSRDGPPSAVAAEIAAAGGEAMAIAGSVTDEAAVAAMVAEVLDRWGRIDILVNNAGILRDKSFAKMTLDDFRLVVDVHLMGAVICTKAVWEIDARAALWPHRDDDLVVRPLRQLRPGELRRGQDGAGRADADAGDRRREIRHPRQLPGADRATGMTEGVLSAQALRLLAPEMVSPACWRWSARARRPGRSCARAQGISRPRT